MKSILKLTAILAVGCLTSIAAHAQSYVCADPTGGTSNGFAIDSSFSSKVTNTAGQNTSSCNVLINFMSNGSIVTTNPNTAGFYDTGADDNLVGVINNTSSTIFSFYLSSASEDIFGFDADGICGGYTFSNKGPNCGTAFNASSPIADYLPQGVTLSGLGAGCGDVDKCGTVNFGNGGIAAGGSAFFSLEDPVDLNLKVTPSGTPEPSSLILLGTGALGLAGSFRRRILNAVR